MPNDYFVAKIACGKIKTTDKKTVVYCYLSRITFLRQILFSALP